MNQEVKFVIRKDYVAQETIKETVICKGRPSVSWRWQYKLCAWTHVSPELPSKL